MTKFYCVVLTLSLILSTADVSAQQITFFESFDEIDPLTLPEGWTAWQNGGGGGAPSPVWWAMRDGPWGVEQYAMSLEEPGRDGLIDEDWMITPQITPQEGDFLIFSSRRGWDETGDSYKILISTSSNQAPNAFTEVLASYTEAEFPSLMTKMTIDLSAYAGMPIHIAFVHSSNVGAEGWSGFWLVDEIQVRPIQSAFVVDAFFRQATTPPQPPVVLGDELVFAGTVEFVLNGDHGTANISSLTLSTHGTTDLALVKEVIAYYTPFEGVSDDDVLNGVLPVFGSIENPGETFELTGSIDLELGTAPFFYFRYILNDDYEISFPYPQIDMTVEKYVANGVERIPSVTTYFGAMDVVPPLVVNDNFADAIELSPTPARYGSSTLPATYEPEYDVIAYCHNFGHEAIHSVWWHFTAPSDGLVSVNLADSRFNSIVAFLDEDLNLLACNDDINDHNQQSRINNFPISAGQKIYVRVSDLGGVGANQYSGAGVVIMDFSFDIPMGREHDTFSTVSSPYPNPATQQTSIEVMLNRPSDVGVEVKDVIGRAVHHQHHQFPAAGTYTIPLDVTRLGLGAYLVQVTVGDKVTTHKLSVIR
jgi:hypothetical protein